MKKIISKDGIASWKIDSPRERFLANKADNSVYWKYKYVEFYKKNDPEYFKKGLKFINKAIDDYSSEGINTSEERRKEYLIDMVYSLHRFGCMFDEYFLFDFEHLNKAGRLEFITDKIRWDYYASFNGRENLDIYNDKSKTYSYYGKYYNRLVCGIHSKTDLHLFDEFIKNNEKIIIKPIDSSGGRGVQIKNTKEISFENLLDEYKTGFIMEQVLKNHKTFSEINESSLNTVRIVTVNIDGKIAVPFAFVRFGRAGKCVDNGFAGGIISNIDLETGIVTSTCDELGKRYIVHPDSKKNIVGFKIPDWNELKELVIEMAGIMPQNRFTGWDMAYTDDGVMIEANPCSQFIGPQITQRKGIKKVFDLLLDEINQK